MNDMHNHVDAEDLSAYLSDNRLWVETYAKLGLFAEAASGYEPGGKAPKTYCPIHGGESGEAFGFIKKGEGSSDRTGIGWCNSCRGIGPYNLVMEATGWSFPDTLEQLAIASGYMNGVISGQFKLKEKTPEQLAREKARAEAQAARDQKNMEKNKQLWLEAFSLNKPEAEPVRLYLQSRGILSKMSALGDEVRFHPAIRYCDISHTACVITQEETGVRFWWIDKEGQPLPKPAGRPMDKQMEILRQSLPITHRFAIPAQKLLQTCPSGMAEFIRERNPVFHKGVGYINDLGDHPCMLTRIRNPNGVPVSLHQTFITLTGEKADVPSVKKIRPRVESHPISGGAAQLCPPPPVLGVAEGLETVLSVETAIGMPSWSLINASLMGSWHPPVGVKRVYIWEDPDPAGESAAEALKVKLEAMGIEVTRVSTLDIHPEGGYDWNDILTQYGPEVFPHQNWADVM